MISGLVKNFLLPPWMRMRRRRTRNKNHQKYFEDTQNNYHLFFYVFVEKSWFPFLGRCVYIFSISEDFKKVGRKQARKLVGPFRSEIHKLWFADSWIHGILMKKPRGRNTAEMLMDCLQIAKNMSWDDKERLKLYEEWQHRFKPNIPTWWEKRITLY